MRAGVAKSRKGAHNRSMNDALRYGPADVRRALAAVRAACADLPEVSERPSHGGPAFFIRQKKTFVMFLDDHHGDGRLAIWCAAPDGVQAEMVETEPTRFFRPPYVDQAELNAIVLDAYKTVAPKTLAALLKR